MDVDTVARLRAMMEAMTAGPWAHDPVTGGVGPLCYVEHDGDYRRADPAQIAPDLRGIAALRNLAPKLLAVVEAVQAELDTRDPYYAGDLPGLRQAFDELTVAAEALR